MVGRGVDIFVKAPARSSRPGSGTDEIRETLFLQDTWRAEWVGGTSQPALSRPPPTTHGSYTMSYDPDETTLIAIIQSSAVLPA